MVLWWSTLYPADPAASASIVQQRYKRETAPAAAEDASRSPLLPRACLWLGNWTSSRVTTGACCHAATGYGRPGLARTAHTETRHSSSSIDPVGGGGARSAIRSRRGAGAARDPRTLDASAESVRADDSRFLRSPPPPRSHAPVGPSVPPPPLGPGPVVPPPPPPRGRTSTGVARGAVTRHSSLACASSGNYWASSPTWFKERNNWYACTDARKENSDDVIHMLLRASCMHAQTDETYRAYKF